MQRTNDIQPQSRHRRILVWLFSLLLIALPYTEVLKAATSLPEPMPCHEQTAPADPHQGTDCLHELGDSGCHCCQLQAPPAIGTASIVPIALNLRVDTTPAARVSNPPIPPRTALYRPPKQRAS